MESTQQHQIQPSQFCDSWWNVNISRQIEMVLPIPGQSSRLLTQISHWLFTWRHWSLDKSNSKSEACDTQQCKKFLQNRMQPESTQSINDIWLDATTQAPMQWKTPRWRIHKHVGCRSLPTKSNITKQTGPLWQRLLWQEQFEWEPTSEENEHDSNYSDENEFK